MTAAPVIEVVGISKHFPLKAAGSLRRRPASVLHAVDDVSLRISLGEAVGLVGESGCGKSTLARLMSRLLDPTSGRILIEGRDVTGLSAAAFRRSDLRRAVQMVFQDPTESLNPRFTVFDLIADPVRQLLRPKRRAELAAAVETAARSVGLTPDLMQRLPHQLSGGQKARVGLARAMAVGPRLLVLDEPTSALDVSVQATVLQLLDRIRRERGVALIFVSHDLNVVRLLCSRIAVMYLGQVVEQGSTAQVFGAPRHPYSRALLSAIPTLKPGGPDRTRLDGVPQSPIDPPDGICRLYGRCPAQRDLCRHAAPRLERDAEGRWVRCHFPAGG